MRIEKNREHNECYGEIFSTNNQHRLVLLLAGRVLLFSRQGEFDRSRPGVRYLGNSFTFHEKGVAVSTMCLGKYICNVYMRCSPFLYIRSASPKSEATTS